MLRFFCGTAAMAFIACQPGIALASETDAVESGESTTASTADDGTAQPVEPANAQDYPMHVSSDAHGEDETGFGAHVSLVSDYREHGVSNSGRNPALQGGVEYMSKVGLFGGVWASSLGNVDGAPDAEVQAYGGYAGSTGELEFSIATVYHMYPSSSDENEVEFELEVEHPVGPAEVEAEIEYAPEQNGEADELYAALTFSLPIKDSGFAFKLHGGYETTGGESLMDWEAGITYARNQFTASLGVVGTNRGDADEEGRDAGTAGLGTVTMHF